MATEKRLIDANAPIKETESIINFRKQHHMPTIEYEALLGYLKKLPTVDAVEVVRCKDCIHRHYVDMGDDIGAIGGCGLFGTAMMTCNDFCSYGERRTDNG